ncbi:MAG TPA: TIGR03560 family F420-dependent LLM class oxidoreductase [Thermomicrobiales bacterium]|nr:TIGR03560 family F420-dependent LLM class oxidoreductase [Thermomicrobiales bacterium]
MGIELSIMIEGQDGLSWPRWQRLARAAEDLGFHGLYRSDHFTNPQGPIIDQLETWVSFAWLASNTSRIAFGPLVSPLSFRNPSILAWQASAVDALSGGRLRLGLGAGWQDREHEAFGFDLLGVKDRFDRFEEGVEVVKLLTRATEPVSFAGKYFSLKDAQFKPRSPRADGPPLVIGGSGPKRTLPLAAKFADEWNAVMLLPEDYADRCGRLDELLAQEGREPKSLKRTLMTRCVVGHDEAALDAKIDAESKQRLLARGALIGTPDQIVEMLGRYRNAGVEGVMLQWIDMDDISGLELIAEKVFPQVRS